MATASNVPPGGEGKIDIDFNTLNKSGKTRKQITVHTNDPANRRVKLYVKADLEQYLATDPKRLWFGRFSSLEPITRTCSLTGTKLKSVQFKDVKLKSSVPEGAYTWVINDGRTRGVDSVTLDVTLNPSKLITGRFNHTLQIITDLDQSGIIDVNLSGELTGPFDMNPAKVLFSNYLTGSSYEQLVTISVNSGEMFKLISLESQDPEITYERLSENIAATTHKIKVIYNAESDREQLKARIKLTTDLKAQACVFLDVQGFRKRQPKKLTPRPVY